MGRRRCRAASHVLGSFFFCSVGVGEVNKNQIKVSFASDGENGQSKISRRREWTFKVRKREWTSKVLKSLQPAERI